MNKRLLLLFVGFLVMFTTSFKQGAEDALVGSWSTEDESTSINIYKKEAKYFGKLISSKQQKDSKSIGKDVLWNLVFNAKENKWEDGTIQLPSMHHSASCTIKSISKDRISVTIFHGFETFGKTVTLKRI